MLTEKGEGTKCRERFYVWVLCESPGESAIYVEQFLAHC